MYLARFPRLSPTLTERHVGIAASRRAGAARLGADADHTGIYRALTGDDGF